MTDMTSEREAFEKWYAENAINYERNPIGSRDCSLQWKAWKARAKTPCPHIDVAAVEDKSKLIEARAHYKGVWPDELTSGVMFWRGLRITRVDFENGNHSIGEAK